MNDQEGAGFLVEVEDNERPQGAVPRNEEESYYSHEEQESYEPPLSYD